jgi:hypothetical protein
MNKILAFSAMLVLVSACYNSGTNLDKKNVTSATDSVTKNVTGNVNNVTSSAAATSNATTQAAKQLNQ